MAKRLYKHDYLILSSLKNSFIFIISKKENINLKLSVFFMKNFFEKKKEIIFQHWLLSLYKIFIISFFYYDFGKHL